MTHEPQTSFPRKTVLIAGVGRSGTSWLGKILDSSPQVFHKSHPDDVNRYPWFRGIPSRLDPTPEFDRFREPFARALQQTFWSHSANLLTRPDFTKTFLHNGRWRGLNFGLRAWRKATRGGGPLVRIPRSMFRGDPNNVTFVIKSVVSNMRLAWIHQRFPQRDFGNVAQRDRELGAVALRYILEKARAFVKRSAIKAVRLHDRETAGIAWNRAGLDASFPPSAIVVLKWAGQLYWIAVLGLAVVGALWLVGERGMLAAIGAPVLLMWAYFTLVHAAMVIQDRYHFATIPFIAMLAAGALVAIGASRRAPRAAL